MIVGHSGLRAQQSAAQGAKPNVSKDTVVSQGVSMMDDIKPKYGPVPLAGTKSYFGEKNDYVNDYVRHYLELHNKTLSNVQDASGKPFSVIDHVLEEKHLPKELKYLAVIESALNHKAVSRAGAVGPWQLMESTARMLGLSVNRHRDDRTDWYKSTTAATKYLEILYNDLNDWLLVIAAYNSGPVPVQKAIARTGSHNFWDIKEYLPKETQGHVLAFIATASIFENMSKFINIGSIPLDFNFSGVEEPSASKNPLAPIKPGTTPTATPNATVAPKATTAATPATATTNSATPPAAAPVATADNKPQFSHEELLSMTIVRIKAPLHIGLMAQELGIDKKLLTRWNWDIDQFNTGNDYPTPFYNLRMPKDKLNAYLAKADHLTKKSQAIFTQAK